MNDKQLFYSGYFKRNDATSFYNDVSGSKNNMRLTGIRVLILFVTVVFFHTACTKQLLCSASENSDTVVFEFKTPRTIFPCAGNFRATVTGVEDSRCPINAFCIVAGQLKAVLEIGDVTLQLEKDKSQEITWKNHRFRVTLLDAAPFPGTPVTNPMPSETISVSIVQL